MFLQNWQLATGKLATHNSQLTTFPLMGLNPFRDHDRTTFDVVVVVLFVIITAVVVGWAFLG